MNKIVQTESFVVYDNVLEKDHFEKIWLYVQNENYLSVHMQDWKKVWRISDGIPIRGPNYDFDKLPYNTYVDYIFELFKKTAEQHPEIVSNWTTLSVMPYLYGRETKLNWHNDAKYLGAAIFYVHPYWASTWGGELLMAATPKLDSFPNPCLDHLFEDKFLEYYGYGQYITCKPNRLVLSKNGLWHSINRVDKDAGDHVRASLVGFFA